MTRVVGNASIEDGEPFAVVELADEMAAFDELPVPIRDAIARHPIKVVVRPFLDYLLNADGASELDVRQRFAAILNALEAKP